MIQTMERVMLLVKEELALVNNEISAILIEPEQICKDVKKILCTGSKRIRTIITALYLKACGICLSENSLHIISAGEIIHNASLLHDDVLDNAESRRGTPSFNALYSPNLSILAGDTLLSIATEKLLKINNNQVLQIFLNCTKEMCKAEINQFLSRGVVPDLSDYIKICEGKTACLFQAILESCAIIENINKTAAANFAGNFGVFFQLKNDLSEQSIESDKKNKIFTPKDFLGLEKTMDLIDNYLQKIKVNISALPDNKYKEGLGELLKSL